MSRLEQVMAAALAAGLVGSVGCDTQGAGASDGGADGTPPQYDYDSGGCFPAEEALIPLCRVDAGPDASPVADGGMEDSGAEDSGAEDSGAEESGAEDSGAEDAGLDAVAPDMALPSSPPECVPDLTALGYLPRDLCLAYCGPRNGDVMCQMVDGGLECFWDSWCGVGRRPVGATPVEGEAVAGLGPWLGAAAGLEAAAVGAFEALAERLTALGAPAELVAACHAAAADERRHAQAVRALARRYGDGLRPWTAPEPSPSLLDLALENRVEGCVGETYGALVVAHQARAAQDPAVAQAMAVIAREEAAHAHLSWRIAAWLEPQLTPAERAAVDRAAAEKVASLNTPQMGPWARALVGMPDPAAAQAMAHALAPLWDLTPAQALAA